MSTNQPTTADYVFAELVAQRNAALDHAARVGGELSATRAALQAAEAALQAAHEALKKSDAEVAVVGFAPVPIDAQPVDEHRMAMTKEG